MISIAPSLISGTSVRSKPSDRAPRSNSLMAKMALPCVLLSPSIRSFPLPVRVVPLPLRFLTVLIFATPAPAALDTFSTPSTRISPAYGLFLPFSAIERPSASHRTALSACPKLLISGPLVFLASALSEPRMKVPPSLISRAWL